MKMNKPPVVLSRSEHCISRKSIDPDALKVLYRLNRSGYKAYLVGGAVRDLLLGNRPKDFDIVTDAHPGEIKKLFSNSFLMRAKVLPLSCDLRFFTFSRSTYRGIFVARISIIWKNICPRSSLKPACFPIILNVWHGKPPVTKSN